MEICGHRKRFTDIIQQCLTVSPSSISHVIWDSKDLINPCGTFILFAKTGDLFYRVNSEQFILREGETVTMTVNDFKILEWSCARPTSLCKAEFCLTIHYDCCW